MSDLLKTNVYGGLTVTGNMAVYLDKRDFFEGETVTLLDENGLPKKTEDGENIKEYTLKYEPSAGENLDDMIGTNWGLYDDNGEKVTLVPAQTTIIYSLSTFIFGDYKDSKGRDITTWKGSFQGGNGGSSSEGVIFTDDLVLTERFGRYYSGGSQYTIECKNKTLDWLIKDAFIQASTGSDADFTISTTFSYSPSVGEVERGTTATISWTRPTTSITDYTYGSDLASKISYSGDTTASSATEVLDTLGESFSKTITVTGTASGVSVKTNTGSTEIKNFSKSKQKISSSYKAFQYIYYKQFNDNTDVSSTVFSSQTIKSYNKLSSKVKSTTDYPSTFSINFTEGRKDFVLFIPNELGIKSIDCITEANVPYTIIKKTGTSPNATVTNNSTNMTYNIFYYHLSGQLGQEGSVKFNFTLKK